MKIVDLQWPFNPFARDKTAFVRFREWCLGYVRPLAERGHEVSIVGFGPLENGRKRLEFDDQKISHRIGSKKLGPFSMPLEELFWLRKTRPDWVIFHSLRWPLQLILTRLFLSKTVKIAVMHHAEQPSRGLKKWAQRWADGATDRYFFASKGNAEAFFESKIIRDRSKIVEIMEVTSHFSRVEKGEARRRLGLSNDEKFVLFVGRLHPQKGPLEVVDGFLAFSKRRKPDAPLVVLRLIFQTDELLEAIKMRLEAAGEVGKNVQLEGRVENAELENWLSAADFFTLGSRFEGSSMALAEAMACGCPPILPSIAAFRSIAGDAAIFWPDATASGFETALETAFSEANPRNRSARAGAIFDEKLSWPAIAAGIERAFLEI